MGEAREAALPIRHGGGKLRRSLGETRGEAEQQQGQAEETKRFVKLIEIEFRPGVDIAMNHEPAEAEQHKDERRREPMQRNGRRAPALRRGAPTVGCRFAMRHYRSTASLATRRSTSREMTGKP